MTDHLCYTPRNQCDLQWLRNTCDTFHMYVLNIIRIFIHILTDFFFFINYVDEFCLICQ